MLAPRYPYLAAVSIALAMHALSLVMSPILAAAEGVEVRSVSIIDREIIAVHLVEGEVTFSDDASGNTAYSGHYHEPRLNQVQRYGTLNVNAATAVAGWSINGSGLNNVQPTNVYRKTKINGMAEMEWSDTWDFIYETTFEHTLYLRLPQAMTVGQTYSITLPANAGLASTSASVTFRLNDSRSEALHVNLVGYRNDGSQKGADLYAWLGDGGARDYSSFIGNTVWLYDIDEDRRHEVGAVAFGHAQATEAHGYDHTRSPVWHVDFTGFDTPGRYRLVVDGVGASQDFIIAQDAYRAPLQVSTLGFLYMRIGQDSMDLTPVPRRPLMMPGEDGFTVYETTMHPWHPDWREGSTADPWDDPEHFANYSTGVSNPNAWGGHSDALDWDRHLGHVSIIYDLLLPYLLSNGALHDDDLGLPESGNGIPDVIDEARYEVDFWLRLRTADGGYSHGLTDPTGTKNRTYQNGRAYLAGSTGLAAWANATNAAMLAEAFRISGHDSLMAQYRDAAIEAYDYAAQLPADDQMLDLRLGIGESSIRGRDLRATAAAYLYNLTGDSSYEDVMAADCVVRNGTNQRLMIEYQDEANARNQIYLAAGYLMSPQPINYPQLHADLRSAIIQQAISEEAGLRHNRPSRRSIDKDGGYFPTVQNLHRTLVAHAVAADGSQRDDLLDALVLEADWGLGRNPLNMIQMTTASTELATRRSVENMYTSGRNDGTLGLHPGHTPYLNTTGDWDSSMIMGTPSWMVNQNYPAGNQWPKSELYYNTRYVWAHSEHTPQQTMRGKQALYGYLYAFGRDSEPVERFTLTIGSENGVVQRSPSLFSYPAGSEVTLTPQPNNGYVFSHWQGAASGSNQPLTITVNGDLTINALFEAAPRYELDVQQGSGGGSYSLGQVITVTADAPAQGQQFAGWAGDVAHLADASAASTTVLMPSAAVSVRATYEAIPSVPDVIIYRAGDTRITGTWGTGLAETAIGAFEGAEHYRFSYELSGWWAGFGLDINETEVSAHESLQFAYRGPGAGHTLMVSLRSAQEDGDFVEIDLRETYGLIEIPLQELLAGMTSTQVTGLRIGISGAETGTGTLDLDAIVFRGNDIDNPPQRVILLHAVDGAQWRRIEGDSSLVGDQVEGGQRFGSLDPTVEHIFAPELEAPEASF